MLIKTTFDFLFGFRSKQDKAREGFWQRLTFLVIEVKTLSSKRRITKFIKTDKRRQKKRTYIFLLRQFYRYLVFYLDRQGKRLTLLGLILANES